MALEYELETGRSGMDFTPDELIWRSLVIRDRSKERTVQMANAVAVAMSSDQKAWDLLK